MISGYRFRLAREDNGWWLVRFPGIPEASTEGATPDEARANAVGCVMAALEGYMRDGRTLPRQTVEETGRNLAVLPSAMRARLAAYETARAAAAAKGAHPAGKAPRGGVPKGRPPAAPGRRG
jgi:predicted RNase H-like HicB family nuclease